VSFATVAQPRTVFTVCNHANTAAHHVILDGIALGNQAQIYYEQTTGKLVIYAGTALKSSGDVGTATAIYSVIFNGVSSESYKNGTLLVSGDAGSQSITGYTMGARYDDAFPLNGDVYARVIYDGALSTVNRQRVEAWLKGLTGL